MNTLKGRPAIVFSASLRLLIKEQRNLQNLVKFDENNISREKKHIEILFWFMYVFIALTSNSYRLVYVSLNIATLFLKEKVLFCTRPPLHYKQNRTHLKNKRRHYSEVTGNKEVLLKILRVCPIIALL